MKKKEQQGVKEIARRANVAIATVDRVVHNRTGISAKTQKKKSTTSVPNSTISQTY